MRFAQIKAVGRGRRVQTGEYVTVEFRGLGNDKKWEREMSHGGSGAPNLGNELKGDILQVKNTVH